MTDDLYLRELIAVHMWMIMKARTPGESAWSRAMFDVLCYIRYGYGVVK